MRSLRRTAGPLLAAAAMTTTLLVVPISSAGAAEGDSAGDWFTTETRLGRSLPGEVPEGSLRSRTVALDANAAVNAVVTAQSLASAEPGARTIVPKAGDLKLTLFDEQQLAIDVTEVAVTLDAEGIDSRPTVEVMGTHTEDGGTTASAAFTFVSDEAGNYSLVGGIDRGTEPRVTIEQQATGVARIDEIDETISDHVERADDALVPDGVVPSTENPATEPEPESVPEPDPAAAIPQVDLVVGYVKSMGSKTVTAIKQRVTETNTALATSKANVRLNLVSVIPVSHTQNAKDMKTDLYRLQAGTDSLALLKNQREALGADLAALVVPKLVGGYCGWAWRPSAGGASEYAFSVSSFDTRCGSHTFAHELGHNLGGNHDRAHATIDNIPFSYSYGFQVQGKARDIMAYDCDNTYCPTKMQFSNPNVDFIGYKGLKSGAANANNARSFSAMAPTISKYRNRTAYARLSGADRYATAVAISKHGYPDASKVSTLVVATGGEFPDALSAAPLAAKVGGPLLLTAPTALSAATKTEVQRLKPSKIIIAGGTGAVSAAVETSLQGLVTSGGSVVRLAGGDRYATSLAIAKYGFAATGSAFIATGADYPDALSAGAAAGKLGAPVVLVPGTAAAASAEAKSYLTAAAVKNVYISGGTAIVSSGIQSSVASGRTVKRYAGSDRYNTSVLIANDHHTKGGRMYLASGLEFPDALAGAAVAGRNKAPLILSGKTCVLGSITSVQAAIKPTSVYLLGGAALLAETIRQGQTC